MIRRLATLVTGAASLFAVGAAFTASSAMAHPLGNFTTNQLAVRIDERQARVHYVLDQAEIPSFQQIQRFDRRSVACGCSGRRWRTSARGMAAPRLHHGHHHHDDHHAHHHDGPITMRGLLGLGVSGGIVPCPSALVVLIAAISQHRVGLGMLLIVAFSLGLAAILTAAGLAVIYGGRLMARLRPERRIFGSRFAGAVPAVSASVIVLAGVLITSRAVPQLG